MHRPLLVQLSASLLLSGCLTSAGTPTSSDEEVGHPLDREPLGRGGKADGPLDRFHADRLVPHHAFVASDAVDADRVQAFLESTPYGTRSFLADETIDTGAGARAFSAVLVAVARDHDLNPIVLLATLQKEGSLISSEAAPSRTRVDFALGCGCPDGRGCAERYRGLDAQLDCGADVLRDALDAVGEGDPSRAGYEVGEALSTLDGHTVRPANPATVALYTYTPWVLDAERSGNWLFWNLFRRYSDALGYDGAFTAPFNEGFIGAACETDADCWYDGAVCLRPSGETAEGTGRCTKGCDRLCPDRRAPGYATTFCVDVGESRGLCMAQCDPALGEACGAGLTCTPTLRHSESWVERDACLPPEVTAIDTE